MEEPLASHYSGSLEELTGRRLENKYLPSWQATYLATPPHCAPLLIQIPFIDHLLCVKLYAKRERQGAHSLVGRKQPPETRQPTPCARVYTPLSLILPGGKEKHRPPSPHSHIRTDLPKSWRKTEVSAGMAKLMKGVCHLKVSQWVHGGQSTEIGIEMPAVRFWSWVTLAKQLAFASSLSYMDAMEIN